MEIDTDGQSVAGHYDELRGRGHITESVVIDPAHGDDRGVALAVVELQQFMASSRETKLSNTRAWLPCVFLVK